MSISAPRVPRSVGSSGGEKGSGGGREAGSDAWKACVRRQLVTAHWSDHPALAQGIRFGPQPSGR
jgi:aldehyde dehydrogenase (NAD+)